MNAIERIDAAIHFRRPDRVPVDLHNFQPAARATGKPMMAVFKDGELLAQAMLDAWRKFGHDMILLENGTACNAQACGAQITYMEDSAPVSHEPLLRDLKDVLELTVPDPYRAFPMCEILKATRILAKETAGKAWICARADQGPMDLAAQLRGMDQFMMDLATEEEPDLIEAVLDYSRRVVTRYALALIESGGHSTSIGEAAAGPEVLSPALYRKYAWKHERLMAEELKAAGVVLHNHICGRTQLIAADFVATGATVLEIDHKTDLRMMKPLAAGKATLLGNIDTNVLHSGTPTEVEAACREAISIMGKDGGFILGPGCALGTDTPDANIHALVEAGKKYGAINEKGSM